MEVTNPKFFKTAAEFRKWLEKNHDKAKELWVGYYKKSSGKPSPTWSESVDQALCFGWIDGIRKSIDEERYANRFTPRKPTSNWSNVNIQKMKELIANGQMTPAGLKAYEQRKGSKSGVYSFEQENTELAAPMLKKLKANKKAWEWFSKQAPYYRRISSHWVTSAKQEATRERRLEQLISDAEKGLRIPLLRPAEKKKK